MMALAMLDGSGSKKMACWLIGGDNGLITITVTHTEHHHGSSGADLLLSKIKDHQAEEIDQINHRHKSKVHSTS